MTNCRWAPGRRGRARRLTAGGRADADPVAAGAEVVGGRGGQCPGSTPSRRWRPMGVARHENTKTTTQAGRTSTTSRARFVLPPPRRRRRRRAARGAAPPTRRARRSSTPRWPAAGPGAYRWPVLPAAVDAARIRAAPAPPRNDEARGRNARRSSPSRSSRAGCGGAGGCAVDGSAAVEAAAPRSRPRRPFARAWRRLAAIADADAADPPRRGGRLARNSGARPGARSFRGAAPASRRARGGLPRRDRGPRAVAPAALLRAVNVSCAL